MVLKNNALLFVKYTSRERTLSFLRSLLQFF